MSRFPRDWAWQQPAPSAGAKLVLLALAERANASGIAWPALRTLATACGLSERQIQRHLGTLAAAGLVHVQHRAQEGRPHAPNLYRLPMQTAMTSAVAPVAQPVAEPARGVSSTSPYGDTDVTLGCHPRHPRVTSLRSERVSSASPITVREPKVEPDSSRAANATRYADARAREVVASYCAALGRAGPTMAEAREWRNDAAALVRLEATPSDVADCTRYLATDPWYGERTLRPPLRHVAAHLTGWIVKGRPVAWTPPTGRVREPRTVTEHIMAKLKTALSTTQASDTSEEDARDAPAAHPGAREEHEQSAQFGAQWQRIADPWRFLGRDGAADRELPAPRWRWQPG